MKFKKPERWCDFSKFFDSLPDEFEIVEPGNVQVRWPEGLPKDELEHTASKGTWNQCTDALFKLAAIAPVEKKKRKMAAWMANHLSAPILVDLNWRPANQDMGWRKVGECEVDE